MTVMSCLAINGHKMGGIHQNHLQFIHYLKGAHFLAICGWPLRFSCFESQKHLVVFFHVLSTGNNSLDSAYLIYVSTFVSGLEESGFSEIDPEDTHTHTHIFPHWNGVYQPVPDKRMWLFLNVYPCYSVGNNPITHLQYGLCIHIYIYLYIIIMNAPGSIHDKYSTFLLGISCHFSLPFLPLLRCLHLFTWPHCNLAGRSRDTWVVADGRINTGNGGINEHNEMRFF